METEKFSSSTQQQLNYNEIVYTHSKIVSCNGNHPVFGHPKIYLKFKSEQIVCPYCSKLFIYQKNPFS
ncbi:hypothetical protein COMNV_00889 [Commensalibacter sp. Nvir]|uniref:zinc-finger domain-containing protein n=1 Tax=Commensalibacter sp. Nvir TaxID=3069817 RepID=UPI002D62C56D|nr:hypothetical protein COMNV_00889 [Commensalibacter sp. Nvir]